MKSLKALIFVFTVLINQNLVFAGGSQRFSFLGAKTNALNGLYLAGLDGISNVYQNPAGLFFFSKNFVDITGYLRIEEQQFYGDVRGLHKSFIDEDLNAGAGLFWSFSDQIKAAFAVRSYYEYKVRWPYILLFEKGSSITTIASDMYNQNLIDNISLSAAYNFEPLTVGLSIFLSHVRNKVAFAQTNPKWLNNIGFPAYQFDYSQDGWGWNVNLGLMYQAFKDLRVGLIIKQGFDTDLSGEASTRLYATTDSASSRVDVESKYSAPWMFGLGFLYDFSNDLQFNVDFKYNLYGNLPDKIDYSLNNDTWNNKQNSNDTISGFSATSLPLYYENSIDFGLGLSYKAYDELDIYFGYRYSDSPNTKKTFSLLNPATDHHSFSVGFGYEDELLRIEGSVVYNLGNKNIISDSDFKVHNGTYDAHGVTPSLTFKYKILNN